MKSILYGLVTCSLLAGCSGQSGGSDSTKSSQEALDVTKTGSLIKQQGTVASLARETDRQSDTQAYYKAVKIGNDGVSGQPILVLDANGKVVLGSGLSTLQIFEGRYGFDGSASERVAKYYNRGDLGIGREMHCVDHLGSSGVTAGEIACYVKNYFAGDANTEFAFGLSSNIAFTNMDADKHFATVGMVYRRFAGTGANKVFFVVYDATDKLSYAAALDRVGVQFAAAFTPGGENPVGHGTPGTNFNDHIPSNCVSCHGGQKYNTVNTNPGTRNEVGSLFLPFDLDQFDFDSTHPRDETKFRDLNQIVRRVAVDAGPGIDVNSSVRNQLDVWYNNPTHGATLINNFSQVVPSGWNSPDGSSLYLNVVRGACRNCHMTNDLFHFDNEAEFKANQVRTVGDLCTFAMPHSLQSVRQFWQSGQPAAFEAYLRSPTGGNNSGLADQFHACGPANVATLDPHLIGAGDSTL